jgi:hypothetical protein
MAVDDMDTLGGYLRGRRRESPWRMTRLHTMGTKKFPSEGVSVTSRPP